MSRFNTGNPIGSGDVKDLSDNAKNLDVAENSVTELTWRDRFGRNRKTMHGMEVESANSIQEAKDQADRVIANLGFFPPVDYTTGLNVDSRNFTVTYNGIIYAAQPSAVPFTTGAWDAAQWYPIQNLLNQKNLLIFDTYAEASAAAATLPDGQEIEAPNADGRISRFEVQSGALAFKDFSPDAIRLQSYTALRAYSGKSVAVDITTPGIAGRFYVDAADTLSLDNGGTVIVGADGRRWKREYYGGARSSWFEGGIQSAINSSIGQRLIVDRRYVLPSITIPGSIDIDGDGIAELAQTPGTDAVFIAPSVSGATIFFSRITLTQQRTGSDDVGRFLYNSARPSTFTKFWNVTFRDFGEGAARVAGDGDESTREILEIDKCTFIGGREATSTKDTFVIYAADQSDLTVTDSRFIRGLTQPYDGGLAAINISGTSTSVTRYSRVRIQGNDFDGYGRTRTGHGVGVIDMYMWAEDVIVSGNRFYNSTCSPIRMKGNVKSAIIDSNIISSYIPSAVPSDGNSISVVSATQPPVVGRVVISNNIINGSQFRGINVLESSANPLSLLSIHGNIIHNTGDIGIYVGRANGFSISNNNIKGAGQQGVAIYECSGAGVVSGNTIDTCALSGFHHVGVSPSLSLAVSGNTIINSTENGIYSENVGSLVLDGNIIKDVRANAGGAQRGIRIGGNTGTQQAVVSNNLVSGSYATKVFDVAGTVGVAELVESGNSWNSQVRYGNSAPTVGNYQRGSRVINTSPVIGGVSGWVCVESGSPGVWCGFGKILP